MIEIIKSEGLPEGWSIQLYGKGYESLSELHTMFHRYVRYREEDNLMSYWVHNSDTKQYGMWIPLDVVIRNGTEAVEVGLLLYTDDAEKGLEIDHVFKRVL